jgi:hypothetical protein
MAGNRFVSPSPCRPIPRSRRLAALLLVSAALLPARAASAAFVDAVLEAWDGGVVTASDVGLSRGLRLFGLAPSDAPIGADEAAGAADGRLMEREAEGLDIQVTPDELERAWQAAGTAVGGMDRLSGWLDRIDVSPARARALLGADLRRRRFIELRFRSFAFVSEFDVDDALGPGRHSPAERDATRQRLLEAQLTRSIQEWLAEAHERAKVKLVMREPVPVPFEMP